MFPRWLHFAFSMWLVPSLTKSIGCSTTESFGYFIVHSCATQRSRFQQTFAKAWVESRVRIATRRIETREALPKRPMSISERALRSVAFRQTLIGESTIASA
jgi:hypothetical protein